MLAIALAGPAAATCFDEAGQRYNLPPELLRAITQVESAGRWTAVNRNADGSEDVCGMQVNSFWFPKLSRFGIEREHLLSEPCTCVMAGAWILAHEIDASGYSWASVGQYHTGRSGSAARKDSYARRISDALMPAATPSPQRKPDLAGTPPEATVISRSEGTSQGRRPSKFFIKIEP